MHKSISLIHLSGGIALARGSYLISFRHWFPTFVTLAVFGVTKLLVSRYQYSVTQEVKMSHDTSQLECAPRTHLCHLERYRIWVGT